MAARARRARLVGTIEAIEHMRQVLRGNGHTGVADAQPNALALGRKGNIDAAGFINILARIVDQRHDQALQPLRVTRELDALRDLRAQLDAPLERDRLELQQLAFHQIREVDGFVRLMRDGSARRTRSGLGSSFLVHLRQREQVAHQPLHRLGLVLRAFKPLGLARHAAFGVLERDGCVREDDRERRLQVVGSVGHETTLLRPGVRHRAQRPTAEEDADDEEHQQGRHADDAQRQGQGLPAAGVARVGEGEVHGSAHVALHVDEAQISKGSGTFWRLGKLGGGHSEHIVRDGGRVRAHGAYLPVRVDREHRHGNRLVATVRMAADHRRRAMVRGRAVGRIARGIAKRITGRVGCGFRFAGAGISQIGRPVGRPAARRLHLTIGRTRNGAVERIRHRRGDLLVVEEHDGREHGDQNHRHGRHIQDDELGSQLFKHRAPRTFGIGAKAPGRRAFEPTSARLRHDYARNGA